MRDDKDYLIYYSMFFAFNIHVIVISHFWKFLTLVKVLILDKELFLLILINSWNLLLLFIDSSSN